MCCSRILNTGISQAKLSSEAIHPIYERKHRGNYNSDDPIRSVTDEQLWTRDANRRREMISFNTPSRSSTFPRTEDLLLYHRNSIYGGSTSEIYCHRNDRPLPVLIRTHLLSSTPAHRSFTPTPSQLIIKRVIMFTISTISSSCSVITI